MNNNENNNITNLDYREFLKADKELTDSSKLFTTLVITQKSLKTGKVHSFPLGTWHGNMLNHQFIERLIRKAIPRMDLTPECNRYFLSNEEINNLYKIVTERVKELNEMPDWAFYYDRIVEINPATGKKISVPLFFRKKGYLLLNEFSSKSGFGGLRVMLSKKTMDNFSSVVENLFEFCKRYKLGDYVRGGGYNSDYHDEYFKFEVKYVRKILDKNWFPPKMHKKRPPEYYENWEDDEEDGENYEDEEEESEE